MLQGAGAFAARRFLMKDLWYGVQFESIENKEISITLVGSLQQSV